MSYYVKFFYFFEYKYRKKIVVRIERTQYQCENIINNFIRRAGLIYKELIALIFIYLKRI